MSANGTLDAASLAALRQIMLDTPYDEIEHAVVARLSALSGADPQAIANWLAAIALGEELTR